MNTGTLANLCLELGPQLDGCVTHNGQPISGARLLWAISGLESSHGKYREFVRSEPGYLPGGVYYNRSKQLRALYDHYGVLAGSSLGTFQMMLLTAVEMGFVGHPVKLQEDAVEAKFVVKLILERIIKRGKAGTLAELLDAYNSGTHRDSNVPKAYIRNGILLYESGLPDPVPPGNPV